MPFAECPSREEDGCANAPAAPVTAAPVPVPTASPVHVPVPGPIAYAFPTVSYNQYGSRQLGQP